MLSCDPMEFNLADGTEQYLHLLGQYANDTVDGHFDGVIAKVKVEV
jgi:hypothetical protein